MAGQDSGGGVSDQAAAGVALSLPEVGVLLAAAAVLCALSAVFFRMRFAG